MIKAKDFNEAWAIVDEIFPTDYEKDEKASTCAGYAIYRSPIEFYDYICNLGDRLEINLKDGKSINVWIEKEKENATFNFKFTSNEVYMLIGALNDYACDYTKEFGDVLTPYDELGSKVYRQAKENGAINNNRRCKR